MILHLSRHVVFALPQTINNLNYSNILALSQLTSITSPFASSIYNIQYIFIWDYCRPFTNIRPWPSSFPSKTTLSWRIIKILSDLFSLDSLQISITFASQIFEYTIIFTNFYLASFFFTFAASNFHPCICFFALQYCFCLLLLLFMPKSPPSLTFFHHPLLSSIILRVLLLLSYVVLGVYFCNQFYPT